MIIFQYDQTFEGLLTSLFDAYLLKRFPDELLAPAEPLPLFHEEVHAVVSDNEKSMRVWRAVARKLTPQALRGVVHCWLSESAETPLLLLRFLQRVVDAPHGIETNYADPVVLAFWQLDKNVRYETNRVLQFMRFQKTADGIYFGMMEPRYNVFPLTTDHFSNRFADQPWVIYDGMRNYGFRYDGQDVTEITLSGTLPFSAADGGRLDSSLLDKDESLFQEMWREYFKAISIRERLNPVKQRKDMPVRFWKYLTEKGGHP